ncbi:CCA tRNA nucleotidyltransferase [Candidatus Woesearchaeota archaeon]|nr:MAG: CCA tRNA nucleotidyltransferase [Candidatus Woesearchaeota archaeon]
MPEKEILNLIKPTKEEERKLKEKAKDVIEKVKIKNVKLELGGSVAKGTWLKGNHDIDIYAKFDLKYKGHDISSILKRKLEKFKFSTLHGSRDYFQIKKRNYVVEIVPILNIKNVAQAENITDVSPFHVKWVRKHKELADEMRLAKAFCKANKLYGAESYIKGFSGYVLEILIVNYGSFRNLLKASLDWKNKEVIDVENYYKNNDAMRELNVSKTKSPLIVIDPVQKERNAAAGLSLEKFNLFKKIAKDYLNGPSVKYFLREKLTLKKIKQVAGNNKLIVVQAKTLQGKKDVIGAKLLKVFTHLKKHLILNDFKLLDSGWEWDENVMFYFVLDKKMLSKTKKHFGPPRNSKRLNDFKQKWAGKRICYKNNFAYVVIDRKYRLPEELVKKLIKSEYVTSRVKSVNLIKL